MRRFHDARRGGEEKREGNGFADERELQWWRKSANGGKVKAKGTIFLSNIQMAFVANKSVGNFIAFDMPLITTHIPILTNPRSSQMTSTGHCTQLMPLRSSSRKGVVEHLSFYFSTRSSRRQDSQQYASREEQRADPLQAKTNSKG
ncbi:hypothetical protein LOK49_LG09G01600 [Camellia lanceoleosa]|uniref:Uncharacterized protein n=1 Tax=Camellia lanceoleosa TaxID=1840588 RepID=A0ACC0GIX3_9ERIC|nr:hypothetical protein LOK49_LG09G01600 [Camellia lanceoleosa]